jgi:hypothetical protein
MQPLTILMHFVCEYSVLLMYNAIIDLLLNCIYCPNCARFTENVISTKLSRRIPTELEKSPDKMTDEEIQKQIIR